MSGRIQDNFFALGYTPKETTYGAGVPDVNLDKWFSADEPVLFSFAGDESVDSEEVKGYPGPSSGGSAVNTERGQCRIRKRLDTELLPMMLYSLLGVRNTTGAGPFGHEARHPAGGIDEVLSFSMVAAVDRYESGSYYKMNGCACTRIEITQERGQDAVADYSIVSDGSRVAVPTFVPPALGSALKGTRVRSEHLAAKFGPALEDVSALLRSLNLVLDADPQYQYDAGNTKVSGICHGQAAPTMSGQLVVDGKQGDTNWGYWNNRTEVKLQATWTNGADVIDLLANAVEIPFDAGDVQGHANGIKPTLTLPLRFHFVTADLSSYIWTVTNTVSTYLG